MKKIELAKYGFIRWPEEDFSDDGDRFTCYRVGKRVRVSKWVSKGEAYISARIDDYLLPYEVYSTLPGYKGLNALNGDGEGGVSVSDITEEDIQKLYEDCITYEKAYDDAYNAIDWPTENELRIKAGAYKLAWKECIIKLEEAIKFNSIAMITNLSEYYFKELQRYYKQVLSNAKQFENPQEYAERLFKQTRSLDFMKRDIRRDVDNCFYVTEIYKFIRKANGEEVY
jgi:hypothetical protein